MEVIMETIGLLAGIGTLPVEFIEAVRPQGYRVVCIAVTPGVDARLAAIADAYYDISAFKLDKVIKTRQGHEGVALQVAHPSGYARDQTLESSA